MTLLELVDRLCSVTQLQAEITSGLVFRPTPCKVTKKPKRASNSFKDLPYKFLTFNTKDASQGYKRITRAYPSNYSTVSTKGE